MPVVHPNTERPTILIVEDEPGPRDALRIILRPFYSLLAVETAEAALRLMREQPVDLVTLDLKLPDRQGTDLLHQIKVEHDDVEVIIITGYGSLHSAMDGLRYGAAGYLLKPFNVTELIRLIDQTMAKKRRLDRLRQFLLTGGALWESAQEPAGVWRLVRDIYAAPAAVGSPTAEEDPVPLLSDLLLARCRNLYNHACRVSAYAALLGEALRLAHAQRQALALGAFLHDIGLLALSPWPKDHALPAEREPFGGDIARHPETGSRMVLPFALPSEVSAIIAGHHERFDGSGYPAGLQGDEIPLVAGIVGLADELDHLIAGPGAMTVEEAVRHLQDQAGRHFDPALIAVLGRVSAECRGALPSEVPFSGPAAIPPA
jgi:putative nucleotidyltransferase with HDIG domain